MLQRALWSLPKIMLRAMRQLCAGSSARAVLHAPQKHVPVFLADAPGKEASGRRTEAQAHAASGAASHQRRRRARVAERDDSGKRMQRKARDLLLFPVHNDVFTVDRQIGVLLVTNSVLRSFLTAFPPCFPADTPAPSRFFAAAADTAP